MLGLKRHCGQGKVRQFLNETPKSLIEEWRWRRHTSWVHLTVEFIAHEDLREGEEPPSPTTTLFCNLTKREAKTLARLLNKSPVPYFEATATVIE